MPAPDIILNPPYALVTLSSSSIGIISDQFGFQFGLVALVYSTSDILTVGQTILFEPAKATKIVYGSTIYFVVEETKALFQEVTPP